MQKTALNHHLNVWTDTGRHLNMNKNDTGNNDVDTRDSRVPGIKPNKKKTDTGNNVDTRVYREVLKVVVSLFKALSRLQKPN